MSSAWSITAAVNPPRAVYLDFPLGHTTGKPGEPELQRHIMRSALRAFEAFSTPGRFERLPYEWAPDDAWKDTAMRPRSGEASGAGDGFEDERVERFDVPQYQFDRDRELVDQAGSCETCIAVEP